jgi:hydrolase, NUDIX family
MRNTIHQKGTAMKNPNIPQDWKKEVELYIPKDAREESEKREILTLMEREGDRLLLRECSYAHMTASSVIVNRNRTKMLMAFHKIYQSWAWTGGHADGDGDFEAVARREAQEETGIQNLKKLGAGAASLEVLPVWAHQKHGQMVASHLHLNISYLFEADDTLPLRIAEDENSAVGWIPIAQLEEYVREKDMMPIYQKLLNRANDC